VLDKLLILGPVPPPYGGVSIHVIRFAETLRRQDWQVEIAPYTGSRNGSRLGTLVISARMVAGCWRALLSSRHHAVHIHYGGLGYFLAVAPLLRLFARKTIITFHSVRVLQDIASAPAPLRCFIRRLLNAFDVFVCVRAEIGDDLQRDGLDGPRIVVMPAFLPPAPQETDRERLGNELKQAVVSSEADGNLRLACAAYYLGSGYGHQDIYGVERLLESLQGLDAELPRRLDLFVLTSNAPADDAQKQAETRVLALAAKLVNVTLHLHYKAPLVPVLAACHGFLRPSREDGDSVAIREAQALGLPVLASDVVYRPDGVVKASMNGAVETGDALRDFMAGLDVVNPKPEPEIRIDQKQLDKLQDFLESVKRQSP
jgi:glycosyltransferase involved in cell wall biosynthesis